MLPQKMDEPGHRPVKGLHYLTWMQVEKLDEVISALCALTRCDSSKVQVVLTIQAGELRFIERPVLSEELARGARHQS